jgi:serine/threonine-protein kinase RsbW
MQDSNHNELMLNKGRVKVETSYPKIFMREQLHLTVRSDLKALTDVQSRFEQFCSQQPDRENWSDIQLYCLKLALAEGFSNAVRHAHRHLPPETPIDIEFTLSCDRVELKIWDWGDPFDPDALEEPELGTLRQGGYGWFLLRRLVDRVSYRRDRSGRNCLSLEKQMHSNCEEAGKSKEAGDYKHKINDFF